MTFDILESVRRALEQGSSLAELEGSLLAGADSDDEIAAAWLFAWAHDAVRPTRRRRSTLATAARMVSAPPTTMAALPARSLARWGPPAWKLIAAQLGISATIQATLRRPGRRLPMRSTTRQPPTDTARRLMTIVGVPRTLTASP